jgi:hypothetical protein
MYLMMEAASKSATLANFSHATRATFQKTAIFGANIVSNKSRKEKINTHFIPSTLFHEYYGFRDNETKVIFILYYLIIPEPLGWF